MKTLLLFTLGMIILTYGLLYIAEILLYRKSKKSGTYDKKLRYEK